MSAPRAPMPIGSTRWIVTLASMTTVIALSIDMSLPAQPTLAATFQVDDATAGLTLSVFMIGFAIAQLVVGYLSDAWGRRRVMLGGLALFSASAIACSFAPSIEVLLVFRVLQGVGGSAAPVVARAMVRDTHDTREAAQLMSTMLATLAVAPMIAPSIGGGLLALFGWRSIFATLALCGLVLMAIGHLTLSETLPVERRQVASLGGLVRGFRTFFTTRGTRLPILIFCASFAGQFAYIADSPFVYLDGFHVSPAVFGLLFGSTALALMIASILGGAMLRAGRSADSMVILGTSIILAGGIGVAIGTRVPDLGIPGFLAPMLVFFFGVGLAQPSAVAITLEPVPHLAGTGSSVIGFMTMTSGALAGYFTTKLSGSDPRGFGMVAIVTAVLAFTIATTTVALRRRRSRVFSARTET